VIPLGHDRHKVPVFQSVHRDIKNILILSQLGSSVELTKYREDLHAVEEKGHKTSGENISTCQENHVLGTGKKYNQGIHQRVLMVGCKDHRFALWNILLAFKLHLSVEFIKDRLHIGLDHVKHKISPVNSLPGTPNLSFGHILSFQLSPGLIPQGIVTSRQR